MANQSIPTRDRLIRAAAELFRTRGYGGTGLSEVLAQAQAPKGSMYHHFPAGKADLALAAADWASDGMRQLIAEAFDGAATFNDGATTLCHKLAKLFDSSQSNEGCPVSATLLQGPQTDAFRSHARAIFNGWIADVEAQGRRLGLAEDAARDRAEHLYLLLQGGWQLARARQDSDVLRTLPRHLPD